MRRSSARLYLLRSLGTIGVAVLASEWVSVYMCVRVRAVLAVVALRRDRVLLC